MSLHPDAENEVVEKLRRILNDIMKDYGVGRKGALKIAEMWIVEAEARKKSILPKK